MKKLWQQLKGSSPQRREEGIALVIALLILIMLTVVGLVAIISSSTESTIAINARGSTQALYLAEAGVAQACWWFNKPDTFNISGFFGPSYSGQEPTKFFKERMQQYTSYYVAGSGGPTQFQGQYVEGAITADLYINSRPTLDSIFGNLSIYGYIRELAVFRASEGSNNICTIRVTAVSKTGGERTIEQELAPNRIPGLNAPLQSGLGADWNGNGTIHWGEVLVEGNADLQNNLNQVPYNYRNADLNNPDFDRWFQARIKGTYTGQSAAGDYPYSGTCRTNPDGAGYNPVCHNNLRQNDSTVSIQRWDYQTLKNTAQSQGYYYVADSGGNIHKGSLGGPVVPVDYFFANTEFGFVDNPQQRDPATLSPGDAITITKSGNTNITGTFYVAGNLDIRGLGSGAGVDATAPPNPLCVADASGPCTNNTYTSGEATRDNFHLNGVQVKGALYTTGSMSFQGNPTIYGALVAEGGFASGGNPQIWYDWDLRIRPTGLPPTVKRVWREVRTQE